MPQKNKILEFNETPTVVLQHIDQFQAVLEASHRSGCLGLRRLFSKELPSDQRQKLDLARQVVSHLALDMSKKASVRGRLDVSGFQQKEKLKSQGRTSRGYLKLCYRDYWLSCRLRTVDGSELRLTLGEDVKYKKATQFHKPRLDLKLIPNPNIYTVSQPDKGILQRTHPVAIQQMLARPELVRLSGASTTPQIGATQLMAVAKEAYRCLQVQKAVRTT